MTSIEQYHSECRKKFTKSERDLLVTQGHALSDGSFPIRPDNISDLNNAVNAAPLGGAADETIHKHIRKHWIAAGKPTLKKMPDWLTSSDVGADRSMNYGSEERSYQANLEIRTHNKPAQTHTVTVGGNASGTGSYFVRDHGPGGGFNEQLTWPGALRGTDLSDCKFLTQHAGDPYGSVRGGTLRVDDTSRGMEWELDLDDRSSRHADLLISIERGDLDRCSIGMVVGRDTWDSKYENRTIHTLKALQDISLVNLAANPNTSVGLRDAGNEDVARVLAIATNEKRSGARLSKSTIGALQSIKKAHKAGTKQLHSAVAQQINDLLGDYSTDDGAVGGVVSQDGPFNGSVDGTGSRSRLTQRERDLIALYRERFEDEQREDDRVRAEIREALKEINNDFEWRTL